jgi:L-lactate dehydrogenase (cytochrome)/(S)-mandelate dehydrogenase
MASIESVARFAPQRTWYQVYPARDPAITERQVKRAHDAGCAALVLTVDTPVLPKRERDMRNGMGLPFRPPLPLLLEALTHPVWLFEYLRHGGMPMMQSCRCLMRLPARRHMQSPGFFASRAQRRRLGVIWSDFAVTGRGV